MSVLKEISKSIDETNRTIGRLVSWLVLAMVSLMFFNVITRYGFNLNLVWQQELVGFMHAIVFMAAAGYTLLHDEHVRIDILYQKMSDKKKAFVDLVGTIIFLFPVCFAILYFSADFVTSSWQIFEASPEYMGMPGVFILKTFIWVFALSLILQGVSAIIKSLTKINEWK